MLNSLDEQNLKKKNRIIRGGKKNADRQRIANRCWFGAPLGNKAEEREKEEQAREGYKYRMMQSSNDVRGREQAGIEADSLCFIYSVLWNRSS